MINKNKSEIEKILKEIEELIKDDLSCQFTAQYDEEIETLEKILQATIKTSIQWCEDELDILIDNIEQVKDFIKLHNPLVEEKYIVVNCLSGMIKRQMQLESHLKWLKEQLTKEERKDDN